MRGFAFQVDKLVLEIEDHQLLHELSLEDDVVVEELPSELNLSEASMSSSMSSVAPLPLDPISIDPVIESGVVQLPLDELNSGVIDSVPIPTASSTPARPSAPSASSVPWTQSHSNISIRSSIHRKFFSERLSDSSCSESSMDEEQLLASEGSGEPVVVEPNSQTVESEAPCSTSAASPVDSTEAVASSSSGSVVQPPPTSSSDVDNPSQTPQCVPPSSPQEAASSDALGEAGRLEDPASTVQESVVTGSPSSSPAPSPAIPGALSAPLGSNRTPEGGVADSSEAVDGERPASTEGSGSGQDSRTEGLQAGHPYYSKGTAVGTHPSSPVIGVVTSSPGSSTAGLTAASGLPYQDSSRLCSSPVLPMKQSPVSSLSLPAPLSSPKRPMDQPAVAEKLAPEGPLSPGSGQLSPDASKPSASVVSPGSPPPAPLDSAPPTDQAELLQDSFIQLQTEAGPTSEVQSEEDDADLSYLDVSLEGGAQIPMDYPVIEWLRDEAAKEVTVWDQCLGRMTINEHPGCEFPHVYGIRNNMEFHRKTEIPERKALYDEFHDSLLHNDLMEDDIHKADPFTVQYVLAHLLRAEYSLPEELLPAMEARLKWHRLQIIDWRDEKIQSIKELNSRLEKLSEPEAVPDVVEGSVVPSHWESDSSFQSEEPEQPDSSLLAVEDVKTEEPPEVKTEEPPPEPVKLEDQLLLPFADRLAPDCDDYPWRHPRFRASAFRARQQFCNGGPRIPVWFRGEEQLGEEAVQVPISEKTPVQLVQTALLHQCSEASNAFRRKVQEIRDLERFTADARAACFRAGAGDLQFGLLRAGIAPLDLQFPLVHQETQETGCQANPCAQSTSTQDGPGIQFIKQNLKDCVLQSSSTEIMDGYLKEHGYGPDCEDDRSGHAFRLGPRHVAAVSDRFRPVLPVSPQITPDSEVQDFRDLDHEMYPAHPFRGVHVLAYTDDTYPVVLPTRSGRTIITEQLSHTLLELVKPLPKKDNLLTRSEFV